MVENYWKSLLGKEQTQERKRTVEFLTNKFLLGYLRRCRSLEYVWILSVRTIVQGRHYFYLNTCSLRHLSLESLNRSSRLTLKCKWSPSLLNFAIFLFFFFIIFFLFHYFFRHLDEDKTSNVEYYVRLLRRSFNSREQFSYLPFTSYLR